VADVDAKKLRSTCTVDARSVKVVCAVQTESFEVTGGRTSQSSEDAWGWWGVVVVLMEARELEMGERRQTKEGETNGEDYAAEGGTDI
jgi:hypothetical protein